MDEHLMINPRIEPLPYGLKRPFRGRAVVDAGLLTDYQLRTAYRAIYRNIYLANDIELTARLRAEAAWMFAGPGAVLTGLSAAAVHGVQWLDPRAPAEIIRADRRAPSDLQVRNYSLAPESICIVDGMSLTTPVRTALDIGRLLPLEQAVPILDALIRQTRLDREQVWALVAANRGIRGIECCYNAFARSDGGAATSFQSQVRLVVGRACEWPIKTQIPFYDEWGLVATRAMMGWPQLTLAIECDERTDGDVAYRTRMLAHTTELELLGWRVVWVTPPMMREPVQVFRRVQKEALAARDRLRRR